MVNVDEFGAGFGAESGALVCGFDTRERTDRLCFGVCWRFLSSGSVIGAVVLRTSSGLWTTLGEATVTWVGFTELRV